MNNKITMNQSATRREFVKRSSAALAGSLVSPMLMARSYAAGSDAIKVGVIGCGPRNRGAAMQAMNVDKGVQVTALADLFAGPMNKTQAILKEMKPEQVHVPKEHQFLGLDAFKKVIDSGIDLALIANASRFHADHFAACVKAGVHTFVEKPACMDAPSYHQVRNATEEASQKGLSVVSGQMWRYSDKTREVVKRIHEGQIGAVLAIQLTTMRDNFNVRHRPEGMSEMDFQLYNWTHFHYLSGGFLTKSLVHHTDLALWVMREEPPVSVSGFGGRSAPYDSGHGDCFDHHSVVYEYQDRTKCFGHLTLQPNCYHEVSDIVIGTKGRADLQRGVIQTDTSWRYRGPKHDDYQEEQTALVNSIRHGKPINNGQYMADAAMIGALAQMAVFTGTKVKWEEALQTGHVFGPSSDKISMDGIPYVQPRPDGKYDVPVPGQYKLKG
jgi:myo-inositol 2-dehydrogenase / D-chiro-inositol 1-dehydrogenase